MSDEIKLKAFGLLESGKTPREIQEELEVSYPKILAWRKELEAARESGELHNLINVDKVIVTRVAKEVQQELVDLAEEGEIAAIEGEVMSTLEDIDGYQLLNKQMTTTAMGLTSTISSLAAGCESTKDLVDLVGALANLHNSFFNKNSLSVQVNNQQNNYSDTSMSKFKALTEGKV